MIFPHVNQVFFGRPWWRGILRISTKQQNQPEEGMFQEATGIASRHESPDTSVPSSSKKASKKGVPMKKQSSKRIPETPEKNSSTDMKGFPS